MIGLVLVDICNILRKGKGIVDVLFVLPDVSKVFGMGVVDSSVHDGVAAGAAVFALPRIRGQPVGHSLVFRLGSTLLRARFCMNQVGGETRCRISGTVA